MNNDILSEEVIEVEILGKIIGTIGASLTRSK